MRPSENPTPSTTALDYDSTMIGALELSSKKWVFAVQLPGVKKHTRHVLEPSGAALAELIARLKVRSTAANWPIAGDRNARGRARRILACAFSGAPWGRGSCDAIVEFARDVIDVEMLLRTLLAWLRGEPRVCSMVPVPSEADEEARRAHPEREDLLGERRSILNKIDGILATLGIEGYPGLAARPARAWPICGSQMVSRFRQRRKRASNVCSIGWNWS